MTVEERIKVIFMIRDPRDVLLSHMMYVTHMDKTHRTHNFFRHLENDSDRVRTLLYGEPGIVESIPSVFASYSGWKNCKNVITIRFEDLIGKRGGGNRYDQLASVKKVIHHLQLNLQEDEIETLATIIFNNKSKTFRSGKINQWKDAFEAPQIKLLKSELGETLIEYGYEKDYNW